MPEFKLSNFPFCDHNICGMRTIFNLCLDAYLFLSAHHERRTLFGDQDEGGQSLDAAIVIHCKAGKGRTGVMVISFLLFSEQGIEDPAAADGKSYPVRNAISYYNAKRTMNRKGLTIPSQIRYVQYFYAFLRRELVE